MCKYYVKVVINRGVLSARNPLSCGDGLGDMSDICMNSM